VNRKRFFSTCALIWVGVACGALSPAAADIETHTCDFGIGLYDSSGETIVTFPMFYRPCGRYKLDSVRISMSGWMFAELAVENMTDFPGPLPVSGSGGYKGFVDVVAVPMLDAEYFAVFPFDLAPPDGNPRSGPDYCYFPSLSDVFDASGEDGPASWEGPGNRGVSIRATKERYLQVPPEAMVAVYEGPVYPSISGTLTVEYGYRLIPEPATLALLALGVLMALRGPRRR